MKAVRISAWDRRSSTASRDMLMRKFAERDQLTGARWYGFSQWGMRWGVPWAMAAAAVLVISIVAVPDIQRALRAPVTSAVRNVATAQAESMPEASAGAGALANDSNPDAVANASSPGAVANDSNPEEEGFIPVPFVPPLATGEMVRVVHEELNPAALASLGVSVDPSWTTQLPADVLQGEDGMPRAVRVSEVSSGNGSF
jgi:hypothetical protein